MALCFSVRTQYSRGTRIWKISILYQCTGRSLPTPHKYNHSCCDLCHFSDSIICSLAGSTVAQLGVHFSWGYLWNMSYVLCFIKICYSKSIWLFLCDHAMHHLRYIRAQFLCFINISFLWNDLWPLSTIDQEWRKMHALKIGFNDVYNKYQRNLSNLNIKSAAYYHATTGWAKA